MLTKEQLAKRVYSIGSSDSASILGMNPWSSAYDIWALKTGRVQPFDGNDATRAGDRLEMPILEWAVEEIGARGVEYQVEINDGIMSATLDVRAYLDSEPIIIEAKTGGVTSPLSAPWGEVGSDEIPDHYKIQVQHQLAVAGHEYKRAFVAALIPPRGFQMFVVYRDEEAIEFIRHSCNEFWRSHVVADVPPPDCSPSPETFKRMRRIPKKQVEIDGRLIAEWEQAKSESKAAEKIKDAAEAALLASLGDAESGIYAGGEVTYYETERKGYEVKATTYRSLRNKRAKG